MNAAMLLDREKHIGAAPYQRGATDRHGYANGFKSRNFQTGLGALELSVPQVRQSDTPFRTSLLESGSRSERALKSAIATMHVEGVSTRRVSRIMEQRCGFEVSSGQVSNLNKQLDSEFEKSRCIAWSDFRKEFRKECDATDALRQSERSGRGVPGWKIDGLVC
ncbi:MAG: transposase [Akkermansiaceae bacterium]|nr:transposase [Akkermansiaceae bacterium]